MISQVIEQSRNAQSGLFVSQACAAFEMDRLAFYRCRGSSLLDGDVDLRDQIQRVALEWPQYGYRRITAQLRRDGLKANHKRVLRLMREDNLLCLRKKSFIRTTDSTHALRTYPNLVPRLYLTGRDQLWVSDITYIRLWREWIYLAVILDAFSRRCIGWELDRHLRASLAVEALRMALNSREIKAGLVHHSDRGVQYASDEYTGLLKEQGILISMSRRGNPYDNARAESFMKTLKYEEVYLREYENMAEARERIGQFLEEVYNRKRLHSALGYVPPVEFEQSLDGSQPA